jgi:C1A family cysteine protease
LIDTAKCGSITRIKSETLDYAKESEMAYLVKRFGWIKDLPDQRDHLYSAPIKTMATLPLSIDLRSKCPPVYDQGELGSCTANGIAGMVQFDRAKAQAESDFIPSRLFIYFNERVIEHTVDSDSGAMLRDGIKSVAKQGVCDETMWPYDIENFRTKPSAACYEMANKYRAVQYQRIIRNLNQMKGCMASGFTFVFGFAVYESFMDPEVARTGIVPMPKLSEQYVGGHAVLAVGYDDQAQHFIVRNSWGKEWGQDGYFFMPYGYLMQSQLSDDFWTIRMIAN